MLINAVFLLSLYMDRNDPGRGAPCKNENIVCAYEADDCAVYVVRSRDTKRAIIDCDGSSVFDKRAKGQTGRMVAKLDTGAEVVIDADGVRVAAGTDVVSAKVYAYWSGTPAAILPLPSSKNDIEYISLIRKKICRRSNHKSDMRCRQSTYIFLIGSRVGALNGEYWFDLHGMMLKGI